MIDDFESYEVGVLPSPPWYNSGNSAAYVDEGHSVSGGKSLYLYGVVGGCWGALAHRQITRQLPLQIEFYVYNGSETLSGCHSIYGSAGLNTGPSWTTPGRALIAFDVDDRTGERIIRGCWTNSNDPVEGPNLGYFEQETWYKVTITLDVFDHNVVQLGYWINDTSKGWYYYPAFSYEQDLSYITLQSAEGSAWFDDVVLVDPITGVDPMAFANNLEDNYPNPFNPSTTIKYSIKERAHVSLKIYNVAGQLVRTLVDDMQAPTQNGFSKIWKGLNNQGQPVSSGVYFYRLTAGKRTLTKKMVLLK